MVLSVCRQVLENPADAEDAAQAVFLVLARKAGSLRRETSVAGWLHRVAVCVARAVRKSDGRRRVREQEAMAMRKSYAAAWAKGALNLLFWRQVQTVAVCLALTATLVAGGVEAHRRLREAATPTARDAPVAAAAAPAPAPYH